jgi:hypothetical protein
MLDKLGAAGGSGTQHDDRSSLTFIDSIELHE